jgi:hypothetical protein
MEPTLGYSSTLLCNTQTGKPSTTDVTSLVHRTAVYEDYRFATWPNPTHNGLSVRIQPITPLRDVVKVLQGGEAISGVRQQLWHHVPCDTSGTGLPHHQPTGRGKHMPYQPTRVCGLQQLVVHHKQR